MVYYKAGLRGQRGATRPQKAPAYLRAPDYQGQEVIQDVPANGKSKAYEHGRVHLRLRVWPGVPPFLLFQGGTGMAGRLQRPIEEGDRWRGGTYQTDQG
jgi:hypothetical protein